MSDFTPVSRSLNAARWLIIVMLVALLFSPPLTNLAQLLLVMLVLASSELRGRILSACRQPLVLGALAFYVVLSLGVLYGSGSQGNALSMWGGWRKLLLLPLAAALFDDPHWKLRFVYVLIGISVACALVSYYGWWTHTLFPVAAPELGIVIRNHATQGMIFAVAAFAAATLSIYTFVNNRGKQWLLAATAILLSSNIALITPGRSGYVVLIVCCCALVVDRFFFGRKVTAKSVFLAVGALSLIGVFLLASPLSRQRINQALNEMQTYQQADTVTSMGVRMFFWKNTLSMIGERPLFGYGTGAFEDAYRKKVSGRAGVAGSVTSDPHNQFLKIAAEHGLIGLTVFIVFLATALVQRPAVPFRLLGLGVLAAWCATSLANSHFSTFSEGVFIYLWLGALLANEAGDSFDMRMERKSDSSLIFPS